MLTRDAARNLLVPFGLTLADNQIDTLLQYLKLLLKWNEKINLTSIRTPEVCITRHFGESLILSRFVPLNGRLLDVGSGAGFPGLAIKILAPELEVVLLEPTTKKRAFLKEVARSCQMELVRVEGCRVEEFSRQSSSGPFDIITVRAVGGHASIIPACLSLLNRGGWFCLWVGEEQIPAIRRAGCSLQWLDPVPIPLSGSRAILIGRSVSTEDS